MDSTPNLQVNSEPRRGKHTLYELLIIIFLGIISITLIFPLFNVLMVSIADSIDMGKQAVFLIPHKFDLSAYRIIFSDSSFLSSIGVSTFTTIVGTLLGLFFTICGGYALSKKFPGKRLVLHFIIFTMFFSGGLIPFFLTVKSLGLHNNLIVLFLPVLINTFYLILVIAFFRALPESIEESARMDGANDLRILFQIVIPISTPIMATVALYYAVDRWNEWYLAMLFISDSHKYPLQYLLKEMLANVTYIRKDIGTAASNKLVSPQSMKMAVVVIATLPIALVYPFLQKYFAKGVMIGSIKG